MSDERKHAVDAAMEMEKEKGKWTKTQSKNKRREVKLQVLKSELMSEYNRTTNAMYANEVESILMKLYVVAKMHSKHEFVWNEPYATFTHFRVEAERALRDHFLTQ